MRNPIHVLKSLEEKASVSNYKYERLYRNLYNPEFYLLAYANIAKDVFGTDDPKEVGEKMKDWAVASRALTSKQFILSAVLKS